MQHANGSAGYCPCCIVHVDADRFSAEDIGGKTLAFVTGSVWIDGIVKFDDAAYQIIRDLHKTVRLLAAALQ